MIQILFFMLAAACYAVKMHLTFRNRQDGKFNRFYFFGSEAWRRKYERHISSEPTQYVLVAPPDSPYYSSLKIRYKEKFPWSASALYFVTSGADLAQWLTIKFLMLGYTITYSHGFHFDWVGFILLWVGWTLVFNFTYGGLKR